MRTGKNLLFFFELIGRLTIKLFLLLYKTTFYIGNQFYKLILKLIKKRTAIVHPIKVLPLLILYPIKFTSGILKKINLPKINLPRIKKATLIKVILLISLSASFLSFYFFILKDLPRPHKLTTRNQVISTKIYDRNHQLIYKIYRNQNRTLVKLADLPPYLVQATVAIEDKNFYTHQGFSLRGILRAVKKSFLENTLQGGSTITQQLVKNALLTSEKTLQRKLKEIILAIQVETYFSKEEILQMYFNEVPYGGTAYGVEEAAQTYFGKSARELSLAEAALLAGLPAAPTRFSPFGAHPNLAISRQHEVLNLMVKEGYLAPQQAEEAKTEKLSFVSPKNQLKAPHFVMFVKDLLVEKYGIRLVEEGGLEVTTSLDLNIQNLTQQIVANEIERLGNLHITNGAALITKPSTGEILAMVGSKDYFDQEIDGNVNVTIMERQPGSAIKVVNYAYALENGYTPATIINDAPITYKIPGSPPYSPVNYDNRFHGPITLRTALACSYNVPAVKVLSSFGVDKMIEMGRQLGITTWEDSARFGLSLTLGGGEVKLVDMAVVYGTLANLGKKVDLNPLLEVKDYQGKILEKTVVLRPQALNPTVAFMLTDILKDNQARTPAFGANSDLVIPGHEVAVKTGTTSDKRDNWTIGYTQDFLAAVWVGNNDNSPMGAVASGLTGASNIWHKLMVDLLKEQKSHQFSRPEGLIKLKICSLNGLLPCDDCPTREEYFLPGTSPTNHCQLEKDKKTDKNADSKILEGVSTQTRI